MTDTTTPNNTGNKTGNKTAVMICGHGSRDASAVREFNQLAENFAKAHPEYDVESGFLEFATPVLRTGLDKLKERGADKIVCLPSMLFAAGHVKNDLPSEVNNFAHENPDLDLIYAADLGIDARLLELAKTRIEAALDDSVAREDTLLLVVGRGTNDSDANSNVCKVTRMLWEGLGVGWAETAYSGVAYPLVDQALERVTKMGYKRIVVFPYFLFTGILVNRIFKWVDEAQALSPDVQMVKAGYLGNDPLLLETFAARAVDALGGENAMNCQLCKYREQIIGYEHDHGAAQVGHHHHVQGAGVEENPEDHGVHHGHGHHHHGHTHSHKHED